MEVPDNGRIVAVALAALVGLIAIVLAWRQQVDRSRRGSDLSDADSLHFRRQDRRRLLGAGLMVVLAIGLVVGTEMSPGTREQPNLAWLRLWIGVCLLVLMLLGLALADWVANARYASRHRRSIEDERNALIRNELQKHRGAQADGDRGNGTPRNGSI